MKFKMRKRRNKGTIEDIAFFLVLILMIGVTILAALFIANEIKKSFIPKLAEEDVKASEKAAEVNEKIFVFADWIFVVVFFGIILLFILSSFLFYTHPAFIVVWIILAIIFVIGAVFTSNIFNTLIEGKFNQFIDYIPKTLFIMNHLPLIILCVVIVGIIVIYSKSQTKPAI